MQHVIYDGVFSIIAYVNEGEAASLVSQRLIERVHQTKPDTILYVPTIRRRHVTDSYEIAAALNTYDNEHGLAVRPWVTKIQSTI